jgi:hypothetical protein
MKILNIIKVKDGTPQIIEAFVFYDGLSDNEVQEITERAEYRFCKLIMGPASEIETMEQEGLKRVVMEGYRKGIMITVNQGKTPIYSLHLEWCQISNP